MKIVTLETAVFTLEMAKVSHRVRLQLLPISRCEWERRLIQDEIDTIDGWIKHLEKNAWDPFGYTKPLDKDESA
jgi:hypothetical protein